MNEEILNAFSENEVDTKIIDKESVQEVSFNLFILNELAVCEFKNGSGGVELPSKVKQPHIQYEMALKSK